MLFRLKNTRIRWARGYDGLTFRDPGTQFGSPGAQAAHGATQHARTEGMASPRGPGAKHLANIVSQRDTLRGHAPETERLQATTSPTCVPWSYHPPPNSLEERRGSREHFGTEKSNLQLLGCAPTCVTGHQAEDSIKASKA